MPTFEDLKKMKADYEKALESSAKDALLEHFTSLFRAHPDVQAIRWDQYTPYFNDGSPCVFRVCDPSALMVGGDPEIEYGNGWRYAYEYKHPIFKRIELDEDIVEHLGDGFRITIDRDMNMTVEECEHD